MHLLIHHIKWGRLSLLLLLGLYPHLKTQAQVENRINLSLGFGFTATQDLMVSRFVSRGLNLPLGLEWQRKRPKSQEYISIKYASGAISSSTGFDSNLKQLYMTYGYNHQAFTIGKWQGYLGGEWSNGFIQRQTSGINQSGRVNAFSTLRVVARGVIDLDKGQQIQLTAALPLVAFSIRPGYANGSQEGLIGVDDQSESQFSLAGKAGRWSWLNEFSHTSFSFQYSKNFQKVLSVRWVYTLSRIAYNYPETSQRMVLLNNEVTMVLSYRIDPSKKKKDEKK